MRGGEWLRGGRGVGIKMRLDGGLEGGRSRGREGGWENQAGFRCLHWSFS